MAQAGQESITRRSLFAGAAVLVPAAALAHVPVQTPDAELLALGEQLREAWMKESGLQHDESGGLELAYERCSTIVRQIEQCIPVTLEGFRVQARAILWCHDGDLTEPLHDNQTTDIRLAQHIIRNLMIG